MKADIPWQMIVAKAAPFMPKHGKRHHPKIKKGSRMRFKVTVKKFMYIGVTVSPLADKTL